MDLQPEPLAFIATTDVAGLLRGRSIPWSDLERRAGGGVTLAPADLRQSPFAPVAAQAAPGDLTLIPDPATRALLPVSGAPDITLLLGDLLEPDGAPWECCPRYVLRRALAALHAEFGLTLRAAFAHEFAYTGLGETPSPAQSLDAMRRQGPFAGCLLAALRLNRLVPHALHPIHGHANFALSLAPAQGVAIADQAVLARELARAVAARLGHRAIFAPHPRAGAPPNAVHLHWSLLDPHGHPAAYDEAGPHFLSDEAEHMAAGILHHLPALAAITAPANLLRLRPDLAEQDRGAVLRVCPVHATADEQPASQFHLEFRLADATSSPYLALGALVYAGLDGLRRQRRLADLPRARPLLEAALADFEESVPAAEWFGPTLREAIIGAAHATERALRGLPPAAVAQRYATLY